MKRAGVLKKVVFLAVVLVIVSTFLTPVARVHAAYPTLKLGSRGDAVTRLQQELKNQGYYTFYKVTGYYGPITQNAVIKFQKANGLAVDGIAGNQTQSVLYISGSRGSSSSGTLVLKYGMRGQAVVELQDALKQKGYFYARSTGYYGPITQNAVIAFQKANGLLVDGIAGPQTLRVLYGSTHSTNRDSISSKERGDLYWLARIIHAEAAGEPYVGKVAVGNVIMNRVSSSKFPNTIYNVIFEYYRGIPQFSPVADGTIYNTPNSESMKAAEEAYYGSKPVGSALYFFNPGKASGSWIVRNRKYITTIGNHAFYQ